MTEQVESERETRRVYPETVYTKISVDDLVVYAVKQILEGGEECTFERLVYECFTLFPKQFGLQRYPHWPNSARVGKSWWRCRTDKGWIAGSVQEGFRLTPKGDGVATRIAQKLALDRPAKSRISGRPRERYEAVLRHVRKSQAFRQYLADRNAFSPTEIEMRNVLGGTLESPSRVLRQNLHYYLDIAKTYGDREVLSFLQLCGDVLSRLLKGH